MKGYCKNCYYFERTSDNIPICNKYEMIAYWAVKKRCFKPKGHLLVFYVSLACSITSIIISILIMAGVL